MRFLVDLNMSPRTVALLNDLGHDAIAGKEVMPPRSPDSEIVALAIEENRVVVTMDSDISRIIAESGWTEPSAILIRMPNASVEVVNRALASTLPEVEASLLRGAIISIDGVRHRTHPLPVTYRTDIPPSSL